MSRIIRLVSITMLLVILTVGVAGCFGNFAATRKVYDFNQNFGDKWINQVMFWVLNVVPVYYVAGVVDILLFNTLEFWTGSNPMAMGPTDEVIKYASQDGKDYKITIRQNEVILEDVNNPAEELELCYKPLDKSWYLNSEEGLVKIATINDDKADFYMPSGKSYSLQQAM